MDRLPNEILLAIGKHTQAGIGGQSSLHSLSLSCRRFHNLFQPLMYSYISSDNFSEAFIGFIMRIWRQPELAKQVHRLDLCWSQCDQHDPLELNDEMQAFVEQALEEIFTAEEQESKELWEEHLHGEEGLCGEAWLGLLLVRLTNLRILEFQHEHTELISDILLKAAKHQQPFHKEPLFPHLQEVRACVAWGASWIDSEFLKPFFSFSGVRRIYGTAIGEQKNKNEGGMDLPRHRDLCPVRDITVEEGYWCRGMLDWLAVCTHLEHISITVEIQADEYDLAEEEQFDASKFRLALLPFTTTLQTLRIRYGDAYTSQVIDEKDVAETPFESLKDFTVLETLTVRHDHLVESPDDSVRDWESKPLTEILPHSLVELEITDVIVDHCPELSSGLLKLLRVGDHSMNLQILTLGICREDEEEELGDVFDALKLECEVANVRLNIETV
ncbi:uncharacterized protein N7511_005399 [Penicillium nucicola]|uniref:uncharacterized protein n=1 Tax=Penicillium nucicola TaxID=1850975 RepID=UPI0025459096|nr:uncharacterized protein N7511_005399 [Penicillium nucicola]KAJ5762017.1 hypothetical protein N7511_005399 [Penicillium nucicola]